MGIFNTLGEKNHLQELLLKYLQLHFVVSQLEGGKTPDPEWDSWTLKQLQQDCLNNDSTENFRTLLSAYITVGAAAEGAWGTLASDADGTRVFTGKCKTMEFRRKAFNLFNEIEHSTIENNSSVSFHLSNKFFLIEKQELKNSNYSWTTAFHGDSARLTFLHLKRNGVKLLNLKN